MVSETDTDTCYVIWFTSYEVRQTEMMEIIYITTHSTHFNFLWYRKRTQTHVMWCDSHRHKVRQTEIIYITTHSTHFKFLWYRKQTQTHVMRCDSHRMKSLSVWIGNRQKFVKFLRLITSTFAQITAAAWPFSTQKLTPRGSLFTHIKSQQAWHQKKHMTNANHCCFRFQEEFIFSSLKKKMFLGMARLEKCKWFIKVSCFTRFWKHVNVFLNFICLPKIENIMNFVCFISCQNKIR